MPEKTLEFAFRKGDVVTTINPWSVVAFNAPTLDDIIVNLPEYGKIGPFYRQPSYPGPLKAFVARVLRNATHSGLSIVVAMDVVLEKKPTLLGSLIIDRDYRVLENEEQEMITEGWAFLQDHITWKEWLHLFQLVREYLLVVNVPHPLLQYRDQILTSLAPDAITKCMNTLNVLWSQKSCEPENEFLFISQNMEDFCKPISVGILLFDLDKEKARYPKHSCMPCVGLEQNPGTSNLIATIDFALDEEITLCYVDISLAHTARLVDMKRRFGPTFVCSCIRCQADEKGIAQTSFRDLARLGNLAFQQNQYTRALQFYEMAMTRREEGECGDVFHAIGAVFLAQNQFLKAQRHWRDCTTMNEPTISQHPGIALQLEKQVAFRYFDHRSDPKPSTIKYHSMFDKQCFVTDDYVITHDTCAQIIAWAEDAQAWTRSRHYAVPTNDIPVHHVPSLLEWFNSWMEDTIYPLLGAQFNLDPNTFYVHDAFIVRYLGHLPSNHLPIHVDESTHSFVLTLNSNFTGGGTYFVDYNTTVSPNEPGALVSFRGDVLRHGGNLVTGGVRYILAAFLYHDVAKKRALDKVSSKLNDAKKKAAPFSFGFDL